jgi:hypothetical protein
MQLIAVVALRIFVLCSSSLACIANGSLVTTAWRMLSFKMEQWPPATVIWNKQLITANKGWSSTFGLGPGSNK